MPLQEVDGRLIQRDSFDQIISDTKIVAKGKEAQRLFSQAYGFEFSVAYCVVNQKGARSFIW